MFIACWSLCLLMMLIAIYADEHIEALAREDVDSHAVLSLCGAVDVWCSVLWIFVSSVMFVRLRPRESDGYGDTFFQVTALPAYAARFKLAIF